MGWGSTNLLFFGFPLLLLSLENESRHGAGRLVICFEAFFIGREGGGVGLIRVVQGELGLCEEVVSLHIYTVQLYRFEAVIHATFEILKLDAGHGAICEELGVRGVFLYSACE